MSCDPNHIYAPWSDRQVNSLNAYQELGSGHPFTCPCGCRLEVVAFKNGWLCPLSEQVVQTWAWKWMADWSWNKGKVV